MPAAATAIAVAAFFLRRSRVIMLVTAAAPAAVGMVMIMPVIMIMMVVMAATAAAFMFMCIGIDQRGSKAALDGDGKFARAVGFFHQQTHHFRADAQIIDGAQIMTAKTALAIEHEQRWRALQLVGFHGGGQLLAVGLIVGDGNGDAILLQEHLDLIRRLIVLLLEGHVQTKHGDFLAGECVPQAHRLR